MSTTNLEPFWSHLTRNLHTVAVPVSGSFGRLRMPMLLLVPVAATSPHTVCWPVAFWPLPLGQLQHRIKTCKLWSFAALKFHAAPQLWKKVAMHQNGDRMKRPNCNKVREMFTSSSRRPHSSSTGGAAQYLRQRILSGQRAAQMPAWRLDDHQIQRVTRSSQLSPTSIRLAYTLGPQLRTHFASHGFDGNSARNGLENQEKRWKKVILDGFVQELYGHGTSNSIKECQASFPIGIKQRKLPSITWL